MGVCVATVAATILASSYSSEISRKELNGECAKHTPAIAREIVFDTVVACIRLVKIVD